MRPVPHPDGHDAPGLIDELVPSLAAMVEDVVVGLEDPVRQPVVAHELPDVLNRVELGRFGRQRQEGDVGGDRELGGDVPSGLVEQDDGVCAGGDGLRYLRQMQGHGFGVATGQDESGALALGWADGAEDVGRSVALVVRGGRAGPPSRPAPGDLVLLADAGLVLEPDLYRLASGLTGGYPFQEGGEVFLKASASAAFWA